MLIPCPWCGNRDESEFSYGGEAHLERPQDSCSDKEWTEYIFMRKNIKGEHKERWNHINGCRQWFNVARNTSTDEILQVYNMGESPPNVSSNISYTPCGEPNIGSGNFSTSKKQ